MKIEPNNVYINKYHEALNFFALCPNKLISKNRGNVVASNINININKLKVLKHIIKIKTKDNKIIKKCLTWNNLYFKSFQLLNKAKGVKKTVSIINKCCKGVKNKRELLKYNALFS